MGKLLSLLVLVSAFGCSQPEFLEFTLNQGHAHDCNAGFLVFTRAGRVVRMRADGTDELRLTESINNSQPTWSPAGSHIAFVRRSTEIWIMNHAGGEQALLWALDHAPSQLKWSPDGLTLAYFARDANSVLQIWILRLDDESGPIQLTTDGVPKEHFAWTPTSGLFFTTHRKDEFDRSVLDLRRLGLDGTVSGILVTLLGTSKGLAHSPDGAFLAVTRILPNIPGVRNGGDGQTAMLTPSSGRVVGSVDTGLGVTDTVYSPDSGCLLLRSEFVSGTASIHDLSTGEVRTLPLSDNRVDWTAELGEDLDPVAAFTSTPAGGSNVTLDPAPSTDDFAVVGAEWDLDNDGEFERNEGTEAFVWDFGATGTHTVRLRVRDTVGQTHVVTRDVQVGGAPPPNPDTFTLTLIFEGQGRGLVSGPPELGTGVATGTHEFTFEANAQFFLRAQPLTDSTFGAWTGCDPGFDFGVEGCRITMDQDRTVRVRFDPR